MPLLYQEQTQILRRCFFDVQNELGLGWREEAYHQACKIWLEQNGVPVSSKAPHRLLLGGEVAHTLFPDLVAWDAISVELKAVPRHLAASEFVQLFDYLKCRNDRLGLLVNMGLDRVYIKRLAYEPPAHRWIENWDHWTGRVAGRPREIGAQLRAAVRTIFDSHQTGYGEEVVQKLICFELRRRRLSHIAAPVAVARFRGCEVDESALDCVVVEGCVLLVFTALFDCNQFNVSRGLSFMKALDLRWGVAVNFGREAAEVVGLRVGV